MPYPEFDFSGQGTAAGAPVFDFSGGAVLDQEEEKKKPQRTLLNEATDIILNRPRQALLAPAIYDAKHNDGFINDFVGGSEEFVAALKGQRQDATGAAYLEAKGMGDGLARDIAGGLLDVVTTPIFGPIAKAGGAISSKALPQAGKVVKNLYGAAAAGGIYGAAEGVAEAKPWGEVAMSAADQAAMWPIFDGAFMGLGKVGADAKGVIEQELNKARPGELLNFRNVPGMEGKGIPVAPGANNATPDEIIADQQAKTYPWSREEQVPYINEQAMAEAQAARQQEIMAAQKVAEYPWTRENQYTAPVTRPPLTNDQLALPGGADFIASEQGAKIYPWTKEVPRRGVPVQGMDTMSEATTSVDPMLQKELQAAYDSILAKQGDYLLANAKKGVETSKGAYDQEGNLVGWNAGFSKNDEWYRRLYDELGHEPSKKDIRAASERTLREGHDDIPPDADFLKAEAELKAGRKLPEEWHTLNAEIAKLKWEYPNNPEIYDYVLAMEKERNATLRRGTLDQPINNADALEFVQAADAQRKGLAQIQFENFKKSQIKTPRYSKQKTGKEMENAFINPEGEYQYLNISDDHRNYLGLYEQNNIRKTTRGGYPAYEVKQLGKKEQDNIVNDIISIPDFDKRSFEVTDGSKGKCYVFDGADLSNNGFNLTKTFKNSQVYDVKGSDFSQEAIEATLKTKFFNFKEQEARQRIQDRNAAYKAGNTNIVARNPLDDIHDLAIIGASKLARGLSNAKDWATEMIAEFGEIIRAKIPEIYERAKATLGNEQGSVKLPFGKEKVQPLVPEGPDTMSHIISKTSKDGIQWRKGWDKFYTTAIDDLNRVRQFDEVADAAHFNATGKRLDPEDRSYLAALNTREAGGTSKRILTEGLVDRAGNEIGGSLKSITEQLPQGTWELFGDYLVNRNAPSWMAKDMKVFPESLGYTPEMAMQKVAQYDKLHPEFQQAAQQWDDFWKAFTDEWLVNSGVISKEAMDAMRAEHPFYVKFQRKLADVEMGNKGYKNGGSGQPVKRAVGSERPIVHPMESAIEEIDKIVKTVRKNEVRQNIFKAMAESPDEMAFFGRVVKDNEKRHIEPRTPEEGEILDIIESKIDELGFDPRHGNHINVKIDGQVQQMRIYDKDLLDAVQALEPKAAGMVIEGARQVSRTMKMLTTGSNPIFATRNFARDLPMSYNLSSTLSKTPIQREMQWAWGIVDSIARVATNGKYDPGGFYKTYQALGGGSHTSSIAADRNLLAESRAAIMPKEIQGTWDKVKTGGRAVEKFTNAVETIPRLPEYIRTIEKYGDTAGARKLGLNKAQDLVNFSRRGSISGEADAVIPYLNASLQGIDKIARTWKRDPLEATQRAFISVTIPAIMLWMINKDDPDYQNLSSFTRDAYYCIPKGDGQFIKIAKPREVGVVFASLPERALQTWANDDPEGFRNFSQAWATNFVPAYRPIWAPFSDVRANENFAGAPIVPGYLEGLSPELQYDERTSAPAKAIGSVFGVSPKNLDYLANSYTGIVGDIVIPATSGGAGDNLLERAIRVPGDVFGRTLTADSLYSNEAIANFYKDKEKLDTATRDFNATGKRSKNYDPDRLKMYNKASRDMSDLREQIRTVNASSMPYEQKQQITRQLQQKVVDIATQAANGTYGQNNDWISNWSNSLKSEYGTEDWQQDWRMGQ